MFSKNTLKTIFKYLFCKAFENSLSLLNAAYEKCREETQRWAKTFYLGTLLLPVEKGQFMFGVEEQMK